MCIQDLPAPGLEAYVISFKPHSMLSEQSCYYYFYFSKKVTEVLGKNEINCLRLHGYRIAKQTQKNLTLSPNHLAEHIKL